MICPNWHILDSEAPHELKEAIRENKYCIKLTPPDMHQCNAAKHAMQTFKGNLIAVLARVTDNFPIHEWNWMIPQTIITINLTHNCMGMNQESCNKVC